MSSNSHIKTSFDPRQENINFSSEKSLFACAFAASHWAHTGYFGSEHSSPSSICVFEQGMLWQDCGDAQSRLSIRWPPL